MIYDWGVARSLWWLLVPVMPIALFGGVWLGRKRARPADLREDPDARLPEPTVGAEPLGGRTTADELTEIGKTIAESLDLHEVGQRIVDSVRQMLSAQATGLHSLEFSGVMPTIAVSGDVRSTWAANRVYPPGTGVIGRAVTEGQLIMTSDSLADPRITYPADFRERLEQAGYRAILAVPLSVEGQTVGVLAVGDVAGRAFTDGEVHLVQAFAAQAALAFAHARLFEQARRGRAEAERASRAKDELLAMLGHELRNPLGAIVSAARVLGTPGLPEDVDRRARDVVARQSSHLAKLVDDLVDAGRMLTGKVALERQRLDLTRLVTRAVGTLTSDGRTLEHRMESRFEEGVEVDADPLRLEQAITDLVSNALKYTPAGGTVRLTVRREQASAVFEVADTGQGIDAELLPRVFDLFVQGGRGLERKGGGLGVGLTLVKRLVELHDGTIQAASAGSGQGSVFTMRLPLLGSGNEEVPATTPAGGLHILVVEDHDDSREMMRHFLEGAGHRVSEASDGSTAVAEALRLRPDVAVIDVGLPGLDGFEVAKRIRAAQLASIRLIALSGHGLQQDRSRASEAGFDEHLVKPITPDRLMGALAPATPESRREAV